MYTNEDYERASASVKKDLVIGIPVLVAVTALYVAGIAMGLRWLVYVSAALLFAVCCFTWGMFLGPHVRYRRFLQDMKTGLTRVIPCTFLRADEKIEAQDGARVRPVHILMDADGDERLLYINASKADCLPPEGAHMEAVCFGRHIRSLDAAK